MRLWFGDHTRDTLTLLKDKISGAQVIGAICMYCGYSHRSERMAHRFEVTTLPSVLTKNAYYLTCTELIE